MTERIYIDNPPRPASGDGDVNLSVGGTEVRFCWKGGQLQSVSVDWSGTKAEYSGADVRMRCEDCVVVSPTGTEYCFTHPCAEWQ